MPTEVGTLKNTLAGRELLGLNGILQAVWNSQFYIAGGAVRDALIGLPAKDYDCFFTDYQEDYDFAGNLEDHVRGLYPVTSDVEVITLSDEEEAAKYAGLDIKLMWDGMLILRGKQYKVQCIYPGSNMGVFSLLDTFDWDVNKHALDSAGMLYSLGPAPITHGVMRLGKFPPSPSPKRALIRGIRIAKKLNMVIDPLDFARLCKLIATNYESIKKITL